MESPYLKVRTSLSAKIRACLREVSFWQVATVLSLLISLACVNGLTRAATQSKIQPYLIEVDRLGQHAYAGFASKVSATDPRVVKAHISMFVKDARMVTPDGVLQTAAIYRVYSKLHATDPATARMNDWYTSNAPFTRARSEMVEVKIESAIPQGGENWQVDWTETRRSPQGGNIIGGEPEKYRGIFTTYQAAEDGSTPESELIENPIRIFVKDFNWQQL